MIQFKEIAENNFRQCIRIDTGIDENYLRPIVYQIALSYIYPSKIPLAIYKDEKLVGFVSYEKDMDPEVAYDILVLVIDKKLQGMGLGTLALNAFVDYLKHFGDCNLITLNYNKNNKVAERLYKKAGFIPSGKINKANNEIIMRKELYNIK